MTLGPSSYARGLQNAPMVQLNFHHSLFRSTKEKNCTPKAAKNGKGRSSFFFRAYLPNFNLL